MDPSLSVEYTSLPLMTKPMWLYSNDDLSYSDDFSNILNSFGNQAKLFVRSALQILLKLIQAMKIQSTQA